MKNIRVVISDRKHRDQVLAFLRGDLKLSPNDVMCILDNAKLKPLDYKKSIGELLLTLDEQKKLKDQL
jgi:hypothetical protein